MDDATTRDMSEKVNHKSAYAHHHQDLVVMMERVLQIVAENKVAQAETELVHLKSCQAEMEEAYLAAIKLMKNKADCTLKTWIESDWIRDDEMQELLDMPPAEYQPAIKKKGIPLLPIVRRQEDRPLKSLSPSVDTEEKSWTNTANDGIFLENYPRKGQMWQLWKELCCSKV